jgi:hypothetical protein
MFQTSAFVAAAAFAGAAVAGEPAARPKPADAKAAVPKLRYHSAFKEYRPHAESEIAGWREVNEEMARLGGHAGHLRHEATGQRQSPPKPAAQPRHGSHK